MLAIPVLGYSWYQYNLTPCDKVLEYSIGRFDSHFGLTEKDFKSYITKAEESWENTLSKNLFEYKAEAKFKVNLIYDERQQETVLKQRDESGLNKAETSLRSLDARLALFKSQYDSRTLALERMRQDYDLELRDYEAGVKYWNSHGGAPKKEFQDLENKREGLNVSTAQLNNEAAAINNMVKQLNTLIEERNQGAADYNTAAKAYNQKYGGGAEFNQAEYNGGEINVYQFGDEKSLVAALSHELGHTLNMEHVENSSSIMYYLRDSQNTSPKPTPSAEDLVELKRVCKL